MSSLELARTTPVRPPKVNRVINPRDQAPDTVNRKTLPWKVPNHLNTLIPVGTAITIVAVVK